jgi:hypothetical protein
VRNAAWFAAQQIFVVFVAVLVIKEISISGLSWAKK